MPQTYESPENPYIIETESGAETARLIEQDRLFTWAMRPAARTIPRRAPRRRLCAGYRLWPWDVGL